MEVYRICLTKYAKNLEVSGRPARWNTKGSHMLYTAGSAALACLENLVHRAGVDLSLANFSVVSINIPDHLNVTPIKENYLKKLHPKWYETAQYHLTQTLGDDWLAKEASAILNVPSAIIPAENNFLINPTHSDAKKITINNIAPFHFDQRLFHHK